MTQWFLIFCLMTNVADTKVSTCTITPVASHQACDTLAKATGRLGAITTVVQTTEVHYTCVPVRP